MIIFYKKETGEIVGTVAGRIHSKDQLKIQVGNNKEVNKLVIQWKPVKYLDREGNEVPKDKAFAAEFEPDCDEETRKVLEEVEKKPRKLSEEYKVDVEKEVLVKKTESEIRQRQDEIDEARKIKEAALNKKKKVLEIASDKERPLEERFNALMDLVKTNTNFGRREKLSKNKK